MHVCRKRAIVITATTPHRPFPGTAIIVTTVLTLLVIALSAVSPAHAALVRPWEGEGEFTYYLDVIERPRGEGVVDLVLVVSVPNAELRFHEQFGGSLLGKIGVSASVGDGATTVTKSIELDLAARSRADAQALTVYQVFTLTLENVGADIGRLRCRIRDREAGRYLRLEDKGAGDPQSLIDEDWYRAVERDDAHGLWLGAPLFLAGAPQQEIAASSTDVNRPEHTMLGEFLHPNRRYGIEQSRLQVVFDVEALGLTRENAEHLPRHLLVQILSTELDFAMRDTLELGLDPMTFVARGGGAEIAWEYDVHNLPPGTYQFSCAPLDGYGNAWITEFDVFWSLQTFARPSDEQFLIGSIVLTGDRRDAFDKAGDSGREAILARFWNDHDPVPETPGNEALAEFHRRMSYVSRFLGGFGRSGPVDDRGLVYLMLGEPDEVQQTVIPINERDFFDAIDRVYNAYLPAKSGEVMRDNYTNEEQTIQGIRQKLDRTTSIEKFKSFELWYYTATGRPLFPNVYADMPLGVRFLFLARLGGGAYHLELTNAWDHGMHGK
jgi:GWxTD domain-containing protein